MEKNQVTKREELESLEIDLERDKEAIIGALQDGLLSPIKVIEESPSHCIDFLSGSLFDRKASSQEKLESIINDLTKRRSFPRQLPSPSEFPLTRESQLAFTQLSRIYRADLSSLMNSEKKTKSMFEKLMSRVDHKHTHKASILQKQILKEYISAVDAKKDREIGSRKEQLRVRIADFVKNGKSNSRTNVGFLTFKSFKEMADAKCHKRDYCLVCGLEEAGEDNVIIFCDDCNGGFHELCYGVQCDKNEPWRCDLCQIFGVVGQFIRCKVCPHSGGAMKKLDKNIARNEINTRRTINLDTKKKFEKKFAGHLIDAYTAQNSKSHSFTSSGFDFAHVTCVSIISNHAIRRENEESVKSCIICQESIGFRCGCLNQSCQNVFHPECARMVRLPSALPESLTHLVNLIRKGKERTSNEIHRIYLTIKEHFSAFYVDERMNYLTDNCRLCRGYFCPEHSYTNFSSVLASNIKSNSSFLKPLLSLLPSPLPISACSLYPSSYPSPPCSPRHSVSCSPCLPVLLLPLPSYPCLSLPGPPSGSGLFRAFVVYWRYNGSRRAVVVTVRRVCGLLVATVQCSTDRVQHVAQQERKALEEYLAQHTKKHPREISEAVQQGIDKEKDATAQHNAIGK